MSTSISGPAAARTEKPPADTPRPVSGPRPWFVGDLAALAALAATVGLTWVHSLWLVNGIDLLLLLWLPGVLLLRAVGLRPELARANPAYGAAASLAVLIAAALLVNSVGPGLGDHPSAGAAAARLRPRRDQRGADRRRPCAARARTSCSTCRDSIGSARSPACCRRFRGSPRSVPCG